MLLRREIKSWREIVGLITVILLLTECLLTVSVLYTES